MEFNLASFGNLQEGQDISGMLEAAIEATFRSLRLLLNADIKDTTCQNVPNARTSNGSS